MPSDETDFERHLRMPVERTPEQIEAEERAEKRELEMARAYARVFSGIDGEMVFKDLCNLFEARTSLSENMALTQANEGKRFVILHIRAMMEVAEAGGRGRTKSESES